MATPDLRVLCRRLTSTPIDNLPRLCPVLVGHVLRCGGPLSAPQDAKGKDKSSEAPVLVHKLRTHITSLLTGKSPAGRFAAVCLIKAVVDVGGWESLRVSGPWIRGLIALLQKPDPVASKELAVVALTKIYMLLQGYPTLTREMATPTLPDYVKACLQLIKPSGKPLKVSHAFIETVASSLSKLVVLYPTTLRPLVSQMKAALRSYVAPTSSDDQLIPQSLRDSTRRLFVLIAYTAPKNGSSEEWAKAIRATILDAHGTVDQIFRAVVESWESTAGYRGQSVGTLGDPAGGGDAAEDLPRWAGVQAGAERLIGLLEFLAEYFHNPTKAPVTVPLGELLDLTARITLVTPPSGSEDSIETNPAISRDEKAELWSALSDIHVSVLHLHQALLHRLGNNAMPLATDILDQMVRVSAASHHIPVVRETAYSLIHQLLLLSGPTLPKLTVDSLTPLIQSVCRDILLPTGHLDLPQPQPIPTSTTTTTTTTQKQQKPNPNTASASTNADAYLTSSPTTTTVPQSTPFLLKKATTLLPILFTHLPQPPLPPDLRALLDRTAILSHACDAMLASCLHPYRDSRGRYYPSILPFLVGRFPRELGVEVLRSNLIRVGGAIQGGGGIPSGGIGGVEGMDVDGGGEERWGGKGLEVLLGERGGGVETQKDGEETGETKEEEKATTTAGWGADTMEIDTSPSTETNPFAVTATAVGTTTTTGSATTHPGATVPVRPASPLKRKSEVFHEATEGVVVQPSKRVDTKGAAVATTVSGNSGGDGNGGGNESESDSDSDSDSEGSVQIDMTLDDDEEEEEEEEDEE
ncbi:rRNA processing/ribosome biogenesis-domain-containing protein [Dichotomopilus funicola]|uniref:Pre-rRNA-processing protein RIX1 n=1 Tax=Dichotomopilus funicola TaxID=1934379 RepID=A0AAN6ZRY6_9PEZI|nr:rRNA processing/ribosome biogenesis-domain-containing protein [Dichotomopilus funicola]